MGRKQYKWRLSPSSTCTMESDLNSTAWERAQPVTGSFMKTAVLSSRQEVKRKVCLCLELLAVVQRTNQSSSLRCGVNPQLGYLSVECRLCCALLTSESTSAPCLLGGTQRCPGSGLLRGMRQRPGLMLVMRMSSAQLTGLSTGPGPGEPAGCSFTDQYLPYWSYLLLIVPITYI